MAGRLDGPLSHRLLIVHEMSHVKTLTDEGHGPAWVRTVQAMTARRLPQLAYDLNDALLFHGVSSILEVLSSRCLAPSSSSHRRAMMKRVDADALCATLLRCTMAN